MSKNVKKLYEQFKPSHYLLNLAIDTSKNSFSGVVIISGFKVGRPSQRFTFHQKGLKILKAQITSHGKTGDNSVVTERINHHTKFDEIRIHTKDVQRAGRYTIRLNFKGNITDQMNGLYPSHFSLNGKNKRLFATQFESHHAREVFPCIDEPAAKATFNLTLDTPKSQVVLSNTPIENQVKEKDRLITSFATTPRMSSYLLAFVFGDLEYLEGTTKSGTLVRTYATKQNVKITDFALDVAVKCLDFFEEYFGIEYPLDKCDLIALPDFASGAMENWGCITFREQALLVDPKKSTLATKQYVALVVAHELAHQWFGNLVTMSWWTDLWLNEGFASWIEYLAIDNIFPEWKLWTQFIVDEQQQALKLDALEHTHPVEVPVHHPDEIRTIFDAISYSKGASIINMLHKYLGAQDFQNGLRHYLESFKYKNTVTSDLWHSLETTSGKPVEQFMSKWTGSSGFPLLKVNIDDDTLSLKQERFFINPKHSKHSAQYWPVPLLAGEKEMPEILNEQSISLEKIKTKNIRLNLEQSGFYRVVYNPTQLERFGSQIERGKLNTISRLGILNDLFEAAKAGYTDTVTALHFLNFYKNEDEYPVWDSISSSIASLRIAMNDENLREDMKPFIRQLVRKQLARLGWDATSTESHFDKLLRPIILGLAASSDTKEIVQHCQKLFERISQAADLVPQLKSATPRSRVKRGIDIDPDLRGTVFGTVARLGGKKEFEKLVQLHNQSELTEEKTTLAASITGFKQPELYSRALDMIQSNEVRRQDVSYWLAYSFMNRHARRATWEWLKTNWDWLEINLGNDLSFYRMPIYAARTFSDESFILEYRKFFNSKMSPALKRSYNQGLEMIAWQSAWKARSFKETQNFFKSQQK